MSVAREGVPARGIGDHPLRPHRFTIGELHPHRLAVLNQHIRDPRPVADFAAMPLQALHQLFRNHTNTTFRIVDATGVAIGKHHPGVDHRCTVRRHHRPAETFDVDELQQLFILDVLPGHRTNIEWQPPRQPETGQRRFEEDLRQVGRIL